MTKRPVTVRKKNILKKLKQKLKLTTCNTSVYDVILVIVLLPTLVLPREQQVHNLLYGPPGQKRRTFRLEQRHDNLRRDVEQPINAQNSGRGRNGQEVRPATMGSHHEEVRREHPRHRAQS